MEEPNIYHDRKVEVLDRIHTVVGMMSGQGEFDQLVTYEGINVYAACNLGVIVMDGKGPTSRRLYPWHRVVSFDAHTKDSIWSEIRSL